jgi:MFS family permease
VNDRMSNSSAGTLSKTVEDFEAATPNTTGRKYYSTPMKRYLVWLVSAAAIFSPLSSNIYFPALVTLAQYFRTTKDIIALTITIYMIFQGIAPSLWGPLADCYGRRPILILTLLVYVAANLVLSQAKHIAVLMVFRGIQAAGSSATIALGVFYIICRLMLEV